MSEQSIVYSDVLVIGGGFAGLRAAAAAVRKGAEVALIEKGPRATPDIMGFNVAVEKNDSVEIYEEDLRKSAYRISNEILETILVNNASGEMEFLESIGFVFDRKPDGDYDVLHTLGSKHPRLVHYKALTGINASKCMKNDCIKRGVGFHRGIFIFSLLESGGRVTGAAGINRENGKVVYFIAKAVVLATGGCGSVYENTTYPRGINGDGVAMVYRAGGEVIDMEFQQFEPCAFIHPEGLKGKVIPTTLLRKGAELRNGLNEDFMQNYGLERNSVQKYGLARAMVNEVREGRGTPHGGIYYDVSMMPRKMVVEDHAIFYDPAVIVGIDLTKVPAEVMPAAHTSLGGVRINDRCETTLKGLFAAGEVAGGFYGANRIGGSAGIETLVFGHIAGENAADSASGRSYPGEKEVAGCTAETGLSGINTETGNGKAENTIREIISELRRIMSLKVGIVRNESDLKSAEADVNKLSDRLAGIETTGFKDAILRKECSNMLDISEMMIGSSLIRRESRGVFFREDFPCIDDSLWLGNISIRKSGNKMKLGFTPKKIEAEV